MKSRTPPGVLVAMLACVMSASAAPAAPLATQPTTTPNFGPGPGSFVFTDPRGDPTKPITVWTWVPEDLSPTTPVLFIMHGTLRNGQVYRDNWVEHAKAKHVLLIVPEFDHKNYPGTAYNDGNMFDRSGKLNGPSRWIYNTIEHLFDEVKRRSGDRSERYFLYGHSAGGQVVQRFVLFMPHARYARAVAANPGWYTLPDQDKPFPAGLQNTPTTDAVLSTIIGRDVVVMLGEKDIRTDEADLPRYPAAMAEGPYRFARGQFFFAHLQAASARLRVPLKWRLKTVPNAEHSDRQMSTAAVDVLFPARP